MLEGSEGEGEVLYVDRGDCLERDRIIERERDTKRETELYRETDIGTVTMTMSLPRKI